MRRLRSTVLLVLGVVCWTAGALAADAAKVTLEVTPEASAVARGGSLGMGVTASIAPGWHVNAHEPNQPFLKPTVLTLNVPEGVRVDAITYPTPEQHVFSFAGDAALLVYQGKLDIKTVIHVPPNFVGGQLRVAAELQYQACDDSTCLRPTSTSTAVELAVIEHASFVEPVDTAKADTGGSSSASAEVVDRWLAERGLLFTLAAVALLGLGLNLTPCVYPLISVTIAYFGGQAGGRGRRRVIGLACLYVLGIALSFSIFGLAAALSGGLFGAALQQPVVLLFIAALMVVLALGSFGLYQLQPPAALMRWVSSTGTGAAGALFMGLTMGIVAAPCVGPIVVGLLIFVGSRQDTGLGFLLFFALALGMGLPYIVLAAAAGSLRQLPRSGEWLVWTERLFGCVLLILATYYLQPLLPVAVQPWIVPAAIALAGLYLGFIEPAGRGVHYFPLIKATVGIAMLVVALWSAQQAGTTTAIAWESYEQWASAGAAGEQKPLLIDFAAEWCIPCREMDHTTYVHPAVVREADRFDMVRADVTRDNDSTSAMVEKYDVKGVPTVILFSPRGAEAHRMVGYVGPDQLLEAMRSVK
jgi:thiol:disulfide interchange protein DsbD